MYQSNHPHGATNSKKEGRPNNQGVSCPFNPTIPLSEAGATSSRNDGAGKRPRRVGALGSSHPEVGGGVDRVTGAAAGAREPFPARCHGHGLRLRLLSEGPKAHSSDGVPPGLRLWFFEATLGCVFNCHGLQNLWRSHFGVDEHPFASYLDFQQGYRVSTHSLIKGQPKGCQLFGRCPNGGSFRNPQNHIAEPSIDRLHSSFGDRVLVPRLMTGAQTCPRTCI